MSDHQPDPGAFFPFLLGIGFIIAIGVMFPIIPIMLFLIWVTLRITTNEKEKVKKQQIKEYLKYYLNNYKYQYVGPLFATLNKEQRFEFWKIIYNHYKIPFNDNYDYEYHTFRLADDLVLTNHHHFTKERPEHIMFIKAQKTAEELICLGGVE